ncbi:MAG: 4Fe-4S dicluster domain-containing protein [Bacteroidetes bacterium]|nr:4Fe-4S dicluster domain-containing protein [Bacteroidota bacterium]
MSYKINLNFKKELSKYGAGNWNECFHCGNCTAICPLTEDGFLFPRKEIRAIQMGMDQKIESNIDPWMCYYCGECSETCPRDANPGELMMTLRRYLTAAYDWTGLSKKFYTSSLWEYGAIGMLFVFIVVLFLAFLPPSSQMFSNPSAFVNAEGGVMINQMVDGFTAGQFLQIIHYGDWTMAIIVALLLVSNIFSMFYKVIIKDHKTRIPLSAYFIEFWHLIYNFAVQPKFSKCENKNYWSGHLFLMTGYTIMFIVIVALLPLFQIEEIKPWYHWQRLLGYYATFGILYFLTIATIGRFKKKDVKFKFSHPSDWIFIVMLAMTTITGILVHIFRLTGLPVLTYVMYVFHLAVLVPMIVIEVPFSKWSHLAYRPFAAYFARLKKAAWRYQVEKEKLVTV